MTARVRPEQRIDPLLGKLDLARDLEATVLENYMQLTLGNFEAYADGIARDRDIVLIGISARDLVVGREPAGARRDRRPDDHLRHRVLDRARGLPRRPVFREVRRLLLRRGAL